MLTNELKAEPSSKVDLAQRRVIAKMKKHHKLLKLKLVSLNQLLNIHERSSLSGHDEETGISERCS